MPVGDLQKVTLRQNLKKSLEIYKKIPGTLRQKTVSSDDLIWRGPRKVSEHSILG
jgi:hypothetical protein